MLCLIEALIVLWAILWPEASFPDWKSYFTVGMVVGALGCMALGTPPDLTMMLVTLVLVVTGVISQAEAYEGFADPGCGSHALGRPAAWSPPRAGGEGAPRGAVVSIRAFVDAGPSRWGGCSSWRMRWTRWAPWAS